MSGNKVHNKSNKGNKGNKSILINDETEEHDFSLLRKPVHTSVTGFGQARKIFDFATEELKALLSDECDLLYECKVCRNIFRSLANFISHKRVYCRDKFNSTVHGHFIKASSTLNELMKIKTTEKGYQESLKENGVVQMEIDENDERIPLTKDLTTIVEKLAKNKGVSGNNNNDVQLALQKIPCSNVAVFQTVENGIEEHDSMRTQVNELETLISRNVAVLQKDGRFEVQSSNSEEMENVIQISDDDDCDTTELKCKKCGMQFSTQKTLRFHMKYKHVESRLVFPCPDCLDIFSTSWSVYRHLFKVHRKTAPQIRRMRESIQAKAFKMNNPPAFYEKRKNMKTPAPPKITEEERIEQENQAWMDSLELSGGMPRCGGCGRGFERRAALAAHAATCAPRDRALRRADRPDRRIEIQIRKDYHKGPHQHPTQPHPVLPEKPVEAVEPPKKPSKEPEILPKEPEKPPKEPEKPPKEPEKPPKEPEKPPKEPEKPPKEPEKPPDEPKKVPEEAKNIPSEIRKVPDEPQKVPAETKKVPEDTKTVDETSMDSVSRRSEDGTSTETDSPEKNNEANQTEEKIIKLPYALHAEKSNLMALRQRIITDIVLDKLMCKKCESTHNHIQELYDHVATTHYKWVRYACKLCNFKHYDLGKLPEHVKIVHKLKGDRDFYFSTVKALDGAEALELSEPVEETQETSENSPESRRPSRCSSDSSRLSDDSTSSNKVDTGTRKRKTVPNKGIGKRRRETCIRVDDEKDDSQIKGFEENSSDMDDVYEKKHSDTQSVASRRPVRRRTKPKNEDFEYDLSNLLKMEAQGYRDSQSLSSNKMSQPKKKGSQDTGISIEILNKEHCGALVTLSRKSVELSKAHMRTANANGIFAVQKERPSSVFVRPMLPKVTQRTDKLSPKKDVVEELKEKPLDTKNTSNSSISTNSDNSDSVSVELNTKPKSPSEEKDTTPEPSEVVPTPTTSSSNTAVPDVDNEKKDVKVRSILPIKFRRESLEVMKNPIINKNIKEFTKAGMKTKILVIKPIHRGKDSPASANTPLKFQTIKLKDTTLNSGEEKTSDQVVVVKVPKVDCSMARAITESANSDKTLVSDKQTNSDKEQSCEQPSGSEQSNEKSNEIEVKPEIIDDQHSKTNGSMEDSLLGNDSEDEKDVLNSSDDVEILTPDKMEVEEEPESVKTVNQDFNTLDGEVKSTSTVTSTTT